MLLVIVGDGQIPEKEALDILADQVEALSAEGDEIGGLVFGATAEDPTTTGVMPIYNWAVENDIAFDAIGPSAELFGGAAYADSDEDAYGALLAYLQSLEADDWTFKVLALFVDPKNQDDADTEVEAFCAEAVKANWPAFMMNAEMFEFATGEAPAAKPAKKAAAKGLGKPAAVEEPEDEDEDVPEDTDADEAEAGWTEANLTPLGMPVLKDLAKDNGVKLTNARSKATVVTELLAWQAEQSGEVAEYDEEGDDAVEPDSPRTGPRPVDETDERDALKAVVKEAMAEFYAEAAGALLAG